MQAIKDNWLNDDWGMLSDCETLKLNPLNVSVILSHTFKHRPL